MGLACTCSLYVYTTISMGLPSKHSLGPKLLNFSVQKGTCEYNMAGPNNFKLAIEEDRSSNCVRWLFWSLMISDILPLQNKLVIALCLYSHLTVSTGSLTCKNLAIRDSIQKGFGIESPVRI